MSVKRKGQLAIDHAKRAPSGTGKLNSARTIAPFSSAAPVINTSDLIPAIRLIGKFQTHKTRRPISSSGV